MKLSGVSGWYNAEVSSHYVYIMGSQSGVLYIGCTHDLVQRVYQHKHKMAEGFTKKYYVHSLLYFEDFEDHDAALQREKQLKKWKREWKKQLIEKSNPAWRDLWPEILES